MHSENDSRVFMNPDGYIEMVFTGQQSPEALQEHITEAKTLAINYEEPVNLLIDARVGRVGRDARSLSLMLGVGWIKNLKKVIILISDDPETTGGAPRSNVIVSVLTSALRLRPIYATDEAEARRLAIG